MPSVLSIMVATSVLCMISAFVKKSGFIPEIDHRSCIGGYFQKLYPNLWCLNISRSGMFESTALSKGFGIAYDWESRIENQNQADNNSHTDKTKGSGYLRVKEPFITICGVPTFEWIKKNIRIEDVSSGFFARFLIFYTPQKDSIPPALPQIKKEVDWEAEQNLKKIVENLPMERAYKLNSEAENKFYDFHEDLYQAFQNEESENAQDILQPYLKMT